MKKQKIKNDVPLRVVMVGHVDHGKSTVLGRLFYDTDSLPEGKYEQIKSVCEKRGMPFEWAFVMDAFKAERDQGITIEVAQIHFETSKRKYVFLDAPGHKEFIKNMVTGAASADAAILVVEAPGGVQEQTRRHGYLLHLMGIEQVVVVVNKMDMAGYDESRFIEVAEESRSYLESIGIPGININIVLVSGRNGDNIADRSREMSWYKDCTLLEALDMFKDRILPVEKPLRLPVQDVYKFDERRIIAGKLEQGHLRLNDEILFSPSNKTAKVSSIESWNAKEPLNAVGAGCSTGIILDEQIFVDRGEVISHKNNTPVVSDVFKGNIFWLGDNPLQKGKKYKLKVHTSEHIVQVQKIEKVINVQDLSAAKKDTLDKHDTGEVILRSRNLMAIDPNDRFVIQENYRIVGGGLISLDGYADQRKIVKASNVHEVKHKVKREDRWKANHHKSGIIWFTGLSSSGKSTLAIALEKLLFDRGYNAYVIDGDNVRCGLCQDLGFEPADRRENIRRIGEMSHLFASAGIITIAAFISPYRSDRNMVRDMGENDFHEVYIKASLETCAKRDPKGLYEKVRKGEISNFTGISAPYEVPEEPDLIIDTEKNPIEECVDILYKFVETRFKLK